MLLKFCALGVTMSWDDGSWERGRPARTKPGTATAISPTCNNRERRLGFPFAWPMRFPPTGWLPAASHGSSAAAKGTACGRDARAPRAITPPLRGSRRSRAARRRLMRWGVSGGRLLRKPTCTLWETPVCPRAGRQPGASANPPSHAPPPVSFPIPRLSAPTPLSEGAPANGQSC